MTMRSLNNGIRVQTYAVNRTVDTGLTTSNSVSTLVFPNTLTNVAIDNTYIETTVQGDTFVGRIIILDVGNTQTNFETRLIISESNPTGTEIEVTVDKPFTSAPVAGTDAVRIPYTMLDATNVNGATYTARTNLLALSRPLFVGEDDTGQGLFGTPAGLQSTNAQYVELSDEGTSNTSLTVVNGANFYVGYYDGQNSSVGSIITAVNNAVAEPSVDVQSGGSMLVYDSVYWSQVSTPQVQFQAGNTSQIYNSKIIQGTDDLVLFDVDLRAVGISGQDLSSEKIRVSAGTSMNGVTITNTGGLDNADGGNTTTEVITLNDVTFISNINSGGNEAFIEQTTGSQNKTFNMIDPVWNATQLTDFTFGTAPNSIRDLRSVNLSVVEPDGTAIPDALVGIYIEDSIGTASISAETTATALGQATDSFNYVIYNQNTAAPLTETITTSLAALRVDYYGYDPFVATQPVTQKVTGVVTLPFDEFLVATGGTRAAALSTALALGTSVTWNQETNSATVIRFENGTGTLSVGTGQSISTNQGTAGSNGTFTGTNVVEFLQGDSVNGAILIADTNGGTIVNGNQITDGTWVADIIDNSRRDFAVWIDVDNGGSPLSYQQTYDFLAGLTASSPLGTTTNNDFGKLIHNWGRNSQARAFYQDAAGFFTRRSNGKGMIIARSSKGGTLVEFTADDGQVYNPPVTYELELSGIKDGSEVRVWRSDNNTLVAGVEDITAGTGTDATAGVAISGTADDGTFNYTYEYGGSGSEFDIYIVVIALEYEYIRIESSLNLELRVAIPISQRFDRNYFNP